MIFVGHYRMQIASLLPLKDISPNKCIDIHVFIMRINSCLTTINNKNITSHQLKCFIRLKSGETKVRLVVEDDQQRCKRIMTSSLTYSTVPVISVANLLNVDFNILRIFLKPEVILVAISDFVIQVPLREMQIGYQERVNVYLDGVWKGQLVRVAPFSERKL